MSKISIISPVYKAESSLTRCVDSILAQTFNDWELILVDDGSPDRSGAICDEYAAKDSRITVIHKANGGVSAARQDGLDAASGDYVVHVDPDDWIEPDMLHALYEKAVVENSDMVIFDYSEDVGGARKVVVQKPSSLDSNVVFKELFHSLHGSCCNKLVRRSLFQTYGIRFPDGYTILEDLYVTAMLCSHDIRISYLPKAYYHYMQDFNQGGLGHKFTKYSVNSVRKFIDAFSGIWESRGMDWERYYYKYCAKSYAFQAKCYSQKEMRLIYPEINSEFRRQAFKNCISRPDMAAEWMSQYLPRIFGRLYCAFVTRAKKVLSAGCIGHGK